MGYGSKPAYPTSVKIAGIVWIVLACILLLSLALKLALLLLQSSGLIAGDQWKVPIGQLIREALGAAFFVTLFLSMGIETVRGTVGHDYLLGMSTLSIVLGLPCVVGLSYLAISSQLETSDLFPAGLVLSFATGLIVAGILGFVGWRRYRAWRGAQRGGS